MDSNSALLAAWHEATFSLSLAPEARRRTIYTAQKLKLNRKSFIAVITVRNLVICICFKSKIGNKRLCKSVKGPYIETGRR